MEYNSRIRLGTVVLNVNNIEKLTGYYVETIGMSVIDKGERHTDLGIERGKDVLIRLQRTESRKIESYGLYHVAILLPDRKALGDILWHFLEEKVPLVGASNHGYSEAIYLEDPEGNGIEVYRDLPQEYWDIRENGNIIGITEAMDVQGVLDSRGKEEKSYSMPKGTRIGHVHLTVKNAMRSSDFYREIFDLGDKMTVPSGSWMASGDYHHHIAVNNWKGPYLSVCIDKKPGLEYFTIILEDGKEYDKIIKNAEDMNVDIEKINESEAFIKDLDNIKVKIRW